MGIRRTTDKVFLEPAEDAVENVSRMMEYITGETIKPVVDRNGKRVTPDIELEAGEEPLSREPDITYRGIVPRRPRG